LLDHEYHQVRTPVLLPGGGGLGNEWPDLAERARICGLGLARPHNLRQPGKGTYPAKFGAILAPENY
jgi:hypothetical protein